MPSIHLRRYRPDDVDAVYEAVMESRAELSPWMPWCHADYARSDAAGWVETRDAAWERNEEWSFVIADKADRILGGCGIHRWDARNNVAEIGYWVRTSAARQGIATAAVRELIAWGIAARNLHRFEILADIENKPSQHVAEKCGFTREAILRDRLLMNGRRRDTALYAWLRPK